VSRAPAGAVAVRRPAGVTPVDAVAVRRPAPPARQDQHFWPFHAAEQHETARNGDHPKHRAMAEALTVAGADDLGARHTAIAGRRAAWV